jgi:hypothetical protein
MAEREDILGWIGRAKENNATHMIVACDTYDYEDYPVFVSAEQSASEEVDRVNKDSMQKVMECYNLSMDIELQLNEYRAFHL